MRKMFIVAEIGCNHNGSKNLAKKMVLAAKECGVDAVKFQTFNAEALISSLAPKAEYQKKNTGIVDSQLEMTKKLELSHEDFIELRDYAIGLGLETFSTPFDMESVDFLKEQGQRIWKIPSGEITNLPYLEKIGDIDIPGKWIVLSSGMSTIEEIQNALDILQKNRKNRITILHCNTEYPTPDQDVNLSAVSDLQKTFPEYEIGFSDHSVGYTAAIMAVSYGVKFIEKHFTLDKNFPGPDHKASATPKEMKALVDNIRRAEIMFGCGRKIVTPSEQKNKIVARKSIVARTEIQKGEIYTEENITCKRPGNGISPMHWYDILGKVAEYSFNPDELIHDSAFEEQQE